MRRILSIDRPLTLLGPQTGISAVAGIRDPALQPELEANIIGDISIAADGEVTIDGFVITGSIDDPSDLVIENNFIFATGDAIDITGANSATIRENSIVSTAGSGIVGADVAKFVTITNNNIKTTPADLLGIDLAVVGGLVTVQGNFISPRERACG